MKIQCFDYLGWPVELLKGRPVTNLIRRVLHTRGLRISIGTAPPAFYYTGNRVAGTDRGPQVDAGPTRPLPPDTRMPWGRPDSAVGPRPPKGGLH